MPPLKQKEAVEPQLSDEEDERHKDIKERNRLAALKWRRKKDAYLTELEKENDQLRFTALKLKAKVEAMNVENKVLEEELMFFQAFMTKIMNT